MKGFNWNWWVAFGLAGQLLFGSRFIIQWIASERKKVSYIPIVFWWLSLSGGLITFIYAIHIRDTVFTVAQGAGLFVYLRNLIGGDFSYHNAPEKTAESHREPGVMTVGDVGYLDDDGYLFLCDRKIDMIISGGVNIYPAEIEAALLNHPAVLDAAVFGIPNYEFGEEVKAVVQLAPGQTPSAQLAAELTAYAREHLGGYKVPRSIDFTDEFPRTETGKLLKRQLRDPYWAGRERAI